MVWGETEVEWNIPLPAILSPLCHLLKTPVQVVVQDTQTSFPSLTFLVHHCVPCVQANAQYSTRDVPATALSGYELSHLIPLISYGYILYYNHFMVKKLRYRKSKCPFKLPQWEVGDREGTRIQSNIGQEAGEPTFWTATPYSDPK